MSRAVFKLDRARFKLGILHAPIGALVLTTIGIRCYGRFGFDFNFHRCFDFNFHRTMKFSSGACSRQ